MSYKPQKTPSPGGLRSPRNRALEIGTDPSGFPDQIPYEHGVPAELAGGTYDDRVGETPDPGPTKDPSPFKVG